MSLFKRYKTCLPFMPCNIYEILDPNLLIINFLFVLYYFINLFVR